MGRTLPMKSIYGGIILLSGEVGRLHHGTPESTQDFNKPECKHHLDQLQLPQGILFLFIAFSSTVE